MEAVLKLARLAVEEKLKLAEFIRSQRRQIFQSIEDREQYSKSTDDGENQEASTGTAFAAECLPVASRIIIAGSSAADFRRAVQWATELAPDTDPVSILAGLTLVYLAQEGCEDSPRDPQENPVWERLKYQIQKLTRTDKLPRATGQSESATR
jgi:hypothetical protein